MILRTCKILPVIILLCWNIWCLSADCGVLDLAGDSSPEPVVVRRLVGGLEARRGEFPWQVRLRSFGQLTYSGVLIRSNWVLTAASCFNDNYNASLWTAVLNDLSSTSVDPGETVTYIDGIFLYGGFKRGNSRNNLALVKLKTSASADVKPACVADGTEDLSSHCVITGWGSTGPRQPYSTTLRKVKVRLSGAEDCTDRIAPPGVEDQLCVRTAINIGDAAADRRVVGPCTGDRGSPVLCKTGDRWSVVGVVSSEFACQSSRATAPLVVNVGHFSSWINKILSQF